MAVFNNCHYKCIFSEIESKMFKVSKIEEDPELTHMRRVDATFPFRFTWLSQLHVSPLNKKS